jgi:hypothetical protein
MSRREVSAGVGSPLASVRSGLQRAAALVALLVVPATLARLVSYGRNDGSDTVAFRLGEKWGPLLPLIFGIPAAVLLVAAWAVRFLPGGKAAAEAAPMFRRARTGGPRSVSVLALAGMLVLLTFAPTMAAESYHGVRALSGSGLVLTVGEDTYVTRTEESAGRRRGLNYYLDTPYGEAIAEGRPSDGDRFGVYPADDERAWNISAWGWLASVFVALLTMAIIVGIVALGRSQLRRFVARRRWRGQRPRRVGVLAAAYGTTAALLAAGSSAWVVVDEASAGGTRITMAIPGADEYDLSSFWVRDGEAEHPFYWAEDGSVAAPVQSRRLNENRDDDLRLLDVWATVTVYPTARDAEKAAGLWLDEQQGEPVTLVDGTAGRWDADGTEITTATVRGRVLVTVDIDDWSWEESAEEVAARLRKDASEIRDLVADHRQQILDAELPWWG